MSVINIESRGHLPAASVCSVQTTTYYEPDRQKPAASGTKTTDPSDPPPSALLSFFLSPPLSVVSASTDGLGHSSCRLHCTRTFVEFNLFVTGALGGLGAIQGTRRGSRRSGPTPPMSSNVGPPPPPCRTRCRMTCCAVRVEELLYRLSARYTLCSDVDRMQQISFPRNETVTRSTASGAPLLCGYCPTSFFDGLRLSVGRL